MSDDQDEPFTEHPFTEHRPARVRERLGPGRRPAIRPVGRDRLEKAHAQKKAEEERPTEIGGPSGPEPTRYGDWERNGICTDF